MLREPPGHVRDVTIRPCRSKERVVRLEPFFGEAPVEPEKRGPGRDRRRVAGEPARGLAAQAARLARAEAVASNFTETRFETPDSSIVTP